MNFKVMKNKATHNIKKASPYIFFGTAVVAFVGAIATAISSTRKLDPILKEHKHVRAEIERMKEETISVKKPIKSELGEVVIEETEKEAKKAVRQLYLQTGVRIARLYTPTAAFSAVSLGSFTASVGILRGRYLMTIGALSSVTEAFEKYRNNVIEDAGADKDLEYLYGLKKEKVTLENPETGKKEKAKKLVGTPNGPWTYHFKKFDYETGEGSTQWDPSNIYNNSYILGILAQYQAKLEVGNRVYLHSLLDELGFNENEDVFKTDQQIQAERMAGWLPGDTLLCGLEEGNDSMIFENLAFINGDSPDVTLRFNCRTNVFS